jgi:hypothetical protein
MIAALQHRDRICKLEIDHGIISTLLSKPFVEMEKPFPALTTLKLHSCSPSAHVLPDSFLDGSFPHLRDIEFHGIQFPGLAKLLSSTRDLVNLRLSEILPSGYISPEAMVSCLSELTKLKLLELAFQYPRHLAWTERTSHRQLTVKRVVLPTFTELRFQGDSWYLEDFVSRIDAPLLESFTITFFNEPIFSTPLLRHFISRTEMFDALHQVEAVSGRSGITVTLSGSPQNGVVDCGRFELRVLSTTLRGQLSSLVRLCTSSLPPPLTLNHFRTGNDRSTVHPGMDIVELVEFFRLFTCLKNLELRGRLVPHVAYALRELARGKVTEVLPELQNIFVYDHWVLGNVKEAIGEFAYARRLSGSPVAVHYR